MEQKKFGVNDSSLSPELGCEVKLGYTSIEPQIRFLQGKVLTIIDASIIGSQNKAVKDLIKRVFSEQLTWLLQICAPEMRIVSRDSLIAEGLSVPEIEEQAGII